MQPDLPVKSFGSYTPELNYWQLDRMRTRRSQAVDPPAGGDLPVFSICLNGNDRHLILSSFQCVD